MTDINEILKKQPILLIDGSCAMCNYSVNYILKRERKNATKLHFASIQSPTGQALMDYFEIPKDIETMILIKNYSVHIKSCAALRLALYMRGLWPLLVVFVIIPPPIRNLVYDFIAKRRYKKYGKVDRCEMIEPQFRDRFLDI